MTGIEHEDYFETLAGEEQAQLFPAAPPGLEGQEGAGQAREDHEESAPPAAPSKKERILALYRGGETEIADIIRETGASPSYVASVLTAAGLLQGYFDLYTTTSLPQNIYGKFFRGALSFKSVEAARESVRRIDRLHRYFELLGDRAGQHHAQVVALTGRNRARWSGKPEEAKIFAEWLLTH